MYGDIESLKFDFNSSIFKPHTIEAQRSNVL